MKLHTPKQAKTRLVISISLSIALIVSALVYITTLQWETRQAVIGGEQVTGIGLRDGAVPIGMIAIGLFIGAFSVLFYLGWKSDWAKAQRAKQGGEH